MRGNSRRQQQPMGEASAFKLFVFNGNACLRKNRSDEIERASHSFQCSNPMSNRKLGFTETQR